MSLLTTLQGAADVVGLTRPAAIITSTDPAVRRMLALANVEGIELARRHEWTSLIREATWTTLAAESQGTLASIASDLDQELGARIVNDTIWDRTNDRRFYGPVSSQKWQRMQAAATSGPYSEYRIRAGTLYLYPAPSAGHTGAFEYITKNWCQSSGGTGRSAWAADTDTGVLSEHLMKLGVVWRFKQSNEMSWENDYQIYNNAVQMAIAHDGTRETLDIGERDEYRPMISAPEGSWSL